MVKTSRVRGLLAVTLCCTMLVACTVDQVLADINVLIQIAASIGSAVGNVSPADAAAIKTISDIASAGISAVQTAYTTYKESGATTDLAKLQAAINAVQTNLAQELAAIHVTNPASQQKIQNWVNLISSTLAAIVAALPQLQAHKAGKELKIAVEITPKTLKARWNTEVCQNNAACNSLVTVH